LSDEGKVEFCFEYEPVYPRGVTRGNPKSIRFSIIEGKMGQAQNHENYLGQVHSDLITKYRLQPMEWARLQEYIFDGLDLREELVQIDKLIEQHQPDNVHAYVTEILYNWLKKQKPQEAPFDVAEEIYDDTPDRPFVQEGYRDKYAWWMEQAREKLGEVFYKTYIAYCDLWAVRDKKVLIAVPNDFVREQLEQHMGEISSYFYTAFGTDKVVHYIIQDLSVFSKK